MAIWRLWITTETSQNSDGLWACVEGSHTGARPVHGASPDVVTVECVHPSMARTQELTTVLLTLLWKNDAQNYKNCWKLSRVIMQNESNRVRSSVSEFCFPSNGWLTPELCIKTLGIPARESCWNAEWTELKFHLLPTKEMVMFGVWASPNLRGL